MWNEKKFFQDFVKESEKIQPDKEFVQQLKEMTRQHEIKNKEKRKRQIWMVKYAVTAVAFLICFVGGGIAWSFYNNTGHDVSSEESSYTIDAHAGNKNHEIQSGSFGEETDLEKVISLVNNNNIIIEDENGEKVSEGKREQLLKLLNQAEKSNDTIALETEYTSYFCIGEEKIEIKIYNSEYIVIGNSDIVYQIN